MNDGPLVFDYPTSTDALKSAAFQKIYGPVRQLPQHEQRTWIRTFCDRHEVDLYGLCQQSAMTWDQVREIGADPLCTLGAHTVNHYAVSRLDADEARAEIVTSADRLEQEIGTRPDTFAYPYGDETSAGQRDFEIVQDCGFEAAVTTRKGTVFAEHANHLTALPRASLNGHFQKLRYVDVLMSGTAFTIWNGFHRVKAA
jgi:peptidoglycan/xylan/chitin deacetylase (PgdA/CDA1 family)